MSALPGPDGTSGRSPTSPRIAPISREEYLALRSELGSGPVSPFDADLNISRTWARSPALMMAQTPLQSYLMVATTIPARVKEIAILRVGWRCNSPYEFSQHVLFGRRAGLTAGEMASLGQIDPGTAWSDRERAVIDAVDEMHAFHTISEHTWNALAASFVPAEMIDLISLVGRYWTVAVMANAIGVAVEAGTEKFKLTPPATAEVPRSP